MRFNFIFISYIVYNLYTMNLNNRYESAEPSIGDLYDLLKAERKIFTIYFLSRIQRLSQNNFLDLMSIFTVTLKQASSAVRVPL